MRMNGKLWLVLLATSMMMSCASARMYPVQGPLASETPSAVYSAKLSGAFYSGSITIVAANGEVCKGHWARVASGRSPSEVPGVATVADSSVTEGMPAAWDAVYGRGFYVSHVLGAALYGQAMLTGDKGTILNVEFYRLNPGSRSVVRIDGVAKDNHGNIFKLAF
jgi:hypothetical protein